MKRMKRVGIGGEKVLVSIFQEVGVRGVDVYFYDLVKGDGPTQE